MQEPLFKYFSKKTVEYLNKNKLTINNILNSTADYCEIYAFNAKYYKLITNQRPGAECDLCFELSDFIIQNQELYKTQISIK